MCECRSPRGERDKPGLLRQRLLHQGRPVAGADDGDVVVEVVARVVHGAAAGAAIGAIADPDVAAGPGLQHVGEVRSEEHTSELQSLMRISYAVFCLKKKKQEQ